MSERNTKRVRKMRYAEAFDRMVMDAFELPLDPNTVTATVVEERAPLTVEALKQMRVYLNSGPIDPLPPGAFTVLPNSNEFSRFWLTHQRNIEQSLIDRLMWSAGQGRPSEPVADDPAPWIKSFYRNAKYLAEHHGSIEEAAVADALECDWPGLDGEETE